MVYEYNKVVRFLFLIDMVMNRLDDNGEYGDEQRLEQPVLDETGEVTEYFNPTNEYAQESLFNNSDIPEVKNGGDGEPTLEELNAKLFESGPEGENFDEYPETLDEESSDNVLAA